MKKILALMIAVLMLATLVACGGPVETTGNEETDAPETDAPETDAPETDAPETDAPAVETPAIDSALALIETVWATYGDDEKFAAAGGYGENMNWEGPGYIPSNDEEALLAAQTYFVLSDEAIAMVEGDMGMLMHAMNANTFTAGSFKLKADATAESFAASVKDTVTNNRWMCGFPEKLVIISVGDYVVSAFGNGELIANFTAKVQAAFENATILAEEALA